ncbi:cupin domain-containing protein [Longivirga aurantiaca]|uniref:Cupin domain-containing protein n=1 Tax=Longivirga aurantiaca TaxID=1837743 RepID=A0ABW1SYD5_9ACTN
MAGIARARFENATDVRPFGGGTGQMSMLDIDGRAVGRAVFEPGWQWSKHVQPIAGTTSCQADHAGYILSGRLAVRMDDGTEETFEPGDVMICPPGHDAWTVGQEACVVLDWAGYADYAKPVVSA